MPTHPKPPRPAPTDATGGHVPVAVVGVGALLPGATGVTDFWRGVLEGRDHMSDIPPTHWLVEDHYDPDPSAVDKTYARRGAFLPQVAFDPLEFGMPPKAIPATDTSQLLALLVARSVLDDLGPEHLAGTDRDRVSVVLGTTTLEQVSYSVSRLQRPVWRKAMREAGLPESRVTELCDRIAEHYVPAQEDTFPGALANVVAGRIANKFDFRGSNHTVDAACASSLAALSVALGELTLGRADMVLTGGVDTLTDPGMYLFFSKTPALSPTGDCRPFAENADGTMLGEGLAMFALKRLADAERDGNRVYAVIRGLGSSSDGHGTAVYTPLAQGQAKALRRTYDASRYGPDTVELVEAHGTGTRVGDLAEFTALNTVFTETGRPDRQWCALGSVKSQLGHTKCTAGAVGLLKAVLALHHKVLPPTIKAERPNPDLDLPDSCFYLNTRTRPWVRGNDHPRRAAVSSFGFGGSNFHVTVEEYVAASETGAGGAPAWRCRTAPTELVLLAADSPRELAALCAEYGQGRPLAETARISQRAYRASAPARLAVVATDEADLAAKLARSAETLRSASASASASASCAPAHSAPEGVHLALGAPAPGQVAFLFPGQGSQYVGMGADLAMEAAVARSAWDELGAREWEGLPLHRVVFPAPAVTDTERDAQRSLLRATEWAQPAIAVHSVASLEVLRALGLRPDRVAGHSFGELVALHAAGVLDAPTLLHVARVRGEAMRDAASAGGAMLAVAAGPEEVTDAINGVGHPELWTANRNSPRQTVVGGTVEAVEALRTRLADAGTAAVPLETSTAFHTPLVADAVQRMAVLADSVDIGEPTLTVHGNAEGGAWPTAPDEIRGHIAEHIVTPVDFTAVIESMYADGVRTFVEVGPGAVLSGLVDDILAGREHLAVPLDRKGAHGVTSLQEAMARLAVRGIDLDHEALWTEYAPPRPETAAGRNEETRMTVNISGVNSGRPYPPPGGAPQLPPANPEPGVAPGPCAPDQPAPEHMAPAPATVPVPVFPTQPRVAPYVPAPMSPDSDALSSVLSPPPDWLRVIEQAQAQTAEAHAAYQRAFTESHLAFLRVAETSFAAVLGACGIDAGASTGSRELAVPAVPLPTGSPSTMAEPPELPPENDPRLSASPAVVTMPPPAVERERHEVDVEELLRSVVADRTGFPAEMLKMSMDMAAELGIDSIKRVEILGALMERVGNLPSDEISELSTARTLGDVAEVLRRHTSPPAGPSAHVVPGAGGDLSGRLAGGTGGVAVVDEDGLSGLSGLPAPSETVAPSELSGPPEPSRPRCHIVEAVPEDPVGLAPAGLYGSRLVVTDDGRGTARLVADGLRAGGVDAVAVDEVPADARAVVLLGGLAQAATWENATALQREALRVCGGLAPVLEAEGGLLVVVQDSGGDFGLSGRHGERAWAGGLAALARTAAREWPRATVRAIDCEWGARTAREVAEVIVREILNGGTALDVGLRADGTRLVPHLTPRSSVRSALDPEQTRELGPESLLVVTGGGRGVTAAALRELARAHRPGLVLVGRTRLDDEPAGLRPMTDEAALVRALAAEHLARRPAEHADATPAALAARARHILAVREIRATLEALRQAGSDARYVTADVRDAGELSRALDRVRSEWGRPVTGIVHGAGVLADQRIAEKTEEQFDLVFGTKVAGLRALLDATADDPLETIVLFSSVAARFGNTGQADYAMANEVMDQVACVEQHRRRGCLVRSIAWGPWDGGMVDAGLAAHFARSGVGLIHPEAGAQVFTTELTGPLTPTPRVVVTADGPGGPMGFGGPTSHGRWTGPGAARAAELLIRPDTHGHLADHVPGEAPVVPMAVVLDWFARAVRSWQGDTAEVVLRDLRVLRGIECDVRRRDHRSVLTVTSQPSSFPGGPVEVQLRADGDGAAVLHYRATLAALDATDTGPWPTGHGLPSYPGADVPGADDVYDVYDSPALFHGPGFRALRTVHGLGPDGAAAEVVGAEELGWADDAWHVDPGALDGALQLALLWAERALGRACLPMSVGTARLPRTGALTVPTTCAVRAGRVRGDTARCDVALLAADGAPQVQLLQVELVARPA